MKIDEIRLMFEYHDWANQKIVACCEQVSAEQYAAQTDFGIGFKSLRGTLVHLVYTDWQWRITCEGFYANLLTDEEYVATELTEAQFPTLDSVKARWQTEREAFWAYLDTLDDAKLNGILRYTISGNIVRERVLWHCLYHVVNHGMQHRSEAAALLTVYGQSPGDIDFTVFLNEKFRLPG